MALWMKTLILLLIALLCSPASAAATNTKEVLLDVKWWGGGLSTIGPGCNALDKCYGSVALKFEPFGSRLRVFIFANQGRRPYDAYNNGQRYPDDLKRKSSDGMWVDIEGATFVFQGAFTWFCVLKSPTRIDCSVKSPGGSLSYPVTVQPLPPGPPPTKWPDRIGE